MIAAFKYGKIGIYSNSCAKIWGKGNIDTNSLTALKLLVAESNWSIDAAKCLYMPERPPEAKELISSCTKGKLPNFFIYAKDKTTKQVEEPNNSTMNRIASKIPDPRLKFNKAISKFDYRMLMNLDSDFSVSPENPVIKAYDYWNVRIGAFNDEDLNKKDQELYCYKRIKEKSIEESGKDVDYIANTLVAYLYITRKNSSKKTLWACFGDVILENIKKNIEGKGRICPVCGKRFESNRSIQLYCSNDCCDESNRRQAKERYFLKKKIRNKT